MSRLEEIKEEYKPIDNGLINLYFVKERDYRWLIQQAERVEELEEKNTKYYSALIELRYGDIILFEDTDRIIDKALK